ncbi:hypothetical protein [Archangium lipolyticum]|uniref:hypothetical protein n=1 Tax=Archangium lipolyticum TaxID=2970465 RepID=UPI00214A33EE|nr:hypothetical protein [Archangium lipolyticum]
MKGRRAASVLVLTLVAGSASAQTSLLSNLHDWSVMVGSGVEGYTQMLAPLVDPGVTYGVSVGVRPEPLLGLEVGLEVGYSGAVNELDTRVAGRRGADLVRNGAYAAASVGLLSSRVQPYVMGGLGFSSYNVRGAVPALGDDIVGNVPVGAGVRTSLGVLTADARLSYNVLFDQRFAAGTPAPDAGNLSELSISRGGRYSGTLNLGMTW